PRARNRRSVREGIESDVTAEGGARRKTPIIDLLSAASRHPQEGAGTETGAPGKVSSKRSVVRGALVRNACRGTGDRSGRCQALGASWARGLKLHSWTRSQNRLGDLHQPRIC